MSRPNIVLTLTLGNLAGPGSFGAAANGLGAEQAVAKGTDKGGHALEAVVQADDADVRVQDL